MKKITLALLLGSAIYFSSCSSGRMATNNNNDDVYYSDRYDGASGNFSQSQTSNDNSSATNNSNDSRSPQNNNQQVQPLNQRDRFQDNVSQPDNSQTSTDENGNTYVTNNYYNDDDYYDYAYSSRLRRFYHPYGWGYYDSYYTNMYWYDYNPYSYGVSLYLSYDWWGPRNLWSPGWGLSFNYGNPYYSSWDYGYGGGNYWNGYQNGYAAGYYNGIYNGTFNPYYFNSNDAYSYYYGPRGGHSSVANNSPRGGHIVGELYGRETAALNPRSPRSPITSDGVNAIGRPKRNFESIETNPSSTKGRNDNSPDANSGNIKNNEAVNPRVNNGRPSVNHNNISKGETVNPGYSGRPAETANPGYSGKPLQSKRNDDVRGKQGNNNSSDNNPKINPSHENTGAPDNYNNSTHPDNSNGKVYTNPRENNSNVHSNQSGRPRMSIPPVQKDNQPKSIQPSEISSEPRRVEQHSNPAPQKTYDSPSRGNNSGESRPSTSSPAGRRH